MKGGGKHFNSFNAPTVADLRPSTDGSAVQTFKLQAASVPIA